MEDYCDLCGKLQDEADDLCNCNTEFQIPKPTIEVGTPEYYDTRIDCAAVKSEDGRVWTGKRHHHCFATIKQAGLKPLPDIEAQGFVTMSGRFVTRSEAAALVLQTGQCVLKTPPDAYSEDFY